MPWNRTFIYLGLLACLLGIGACSEDNFAADRSLQGSPANVTPNSPDSPALPPDFPRQIPPYPRAQLLEVDPEATARQGTMRWLSPDPPQGILSFYREAFSRDGWRILAANGDGPNPATLAAQNDDLRAELTLPIPETPNNDGTEFAIAYQRGAALPNATQPTSPDAIETGEALNEPDPSTAIASDSPQSFSDLDQTPEQMRQYVEDLANLGILTPETDSGSPQRFNPNQPIKRRDFARWLLAANNKLYGDRPGQQIRLAADTAAPAFSDVSRSDRDFAVIQGLAEAGILPSPLSGDSSANLFRPDAPLTREEMILWKVPLDLRQGLPSASLESIKETWGFQDAAKTNAKAFRALYADFQNGENANLRRAFGYTTLFQPKQTVTRAQAAAVLWSFGAQGDAITAADTETNQSAP